MRSRKATTVGRIPYPPVPACHRHGSAGAYRMRPYILCRPARRRKGTRMFDKKKNAAESYGVIGLGRFGTALVKTLAAAGKEVIAVDKDEAKVKAVRGYTDYAFVIDELNETSLKETGMQNCGTVTICIGEQIDISILTTMLVTKLGVPHVISKAAS
mgnify:FL=1